MKHLTIAVLFLLSAASADAAITHTATASASWGSTPWTGGAFASGDTLDTHGFTVTFSDSTGHNIATGVSVAVVDSVGGGALQPVMSVYSGLAPIIALGSGGKLKLASGTYGKFYCAGGKIFINSGGTVQVDVNGGLAVTTGGTLAINQGGYLVNNSSGNPGITVDYLQCFGGVYSGTGNLVITKGIVGNSDPGKANVLAPTAYSVAGISTTGSLTLPSGSDVWSGLAYGVSGTGSTGSLAVTPSLTLTSGTVHGTAGTYDATQLSASNVLTGTRWGASLANTGRFAAGTTASGSDVWTGKVFATSTGTTSGTLFLSSSLVLTSGTIHGTQGTATSGGTLDTGYILAPHVLVGSGTGTLTLPPQEEVVTGYAYGIAGSGSTGSFYPRRSNRGGFIDAGAFSELGVHAAVTVGSIVLASLVSGWIFFTFMRRLATGREKISKEATWWNRQVARKQAWWRRALNAFAGQDHAVDVNFSPVAAPKATGPKSALEIEAEAIKILGIGK